MQAELCDSKYKVMFDEKTGVLSAQRYGEEWQDLTGNNLVYWMLVEICQLKEALQSPKSTLQASETPSQGVSNHEVEKALRKAFVMGQNYWYDADADSEIRHRKSDITLENFDKFLQEFSSKFKSPQVGE